MSFVGHPLYSHQNYEGYLIRVMAGMLTITLA